MHEESRGKRKRVILIDLDGTLIRFNSFRCWVLFWTFLLPFSKPGLYKKWVGVLASRIAGRTDRARMKLSLLSIYEDNRAIWPSFGDALFQKLLKGGVRRDLWRALIDQREKGAILCLATAAPEVYVGPLASWLGIHLRVATQRKDGKWKETIGKQKALAVSDILSGLDKKNLRWSLVTDHHDDIPLASRCECTVLIRPSGSTEKKFIESGIPFCCFELKIKNKM